LQLPGLVNLTVMKEMMEEIKKKMKIVMEKNEATKDRPSGFQFAVTALLTTAIFFITWYLIKIIP